MRMLSHFPTEVIVLKKQDGTEIGGIKALVDSNMIFIDDASIDIEEGDTFIRLLPSGKNDCYLVQDRGFFRGMGSIPDHYQVKVKKQSGTNPYQTSTVSNYHNYNITNSDKVNINSTDNSTNVLFTKEVVELFTSLLNTAKGLSDDLIVQSIQDMQNQVGKKGFIEKYSQFIASVADHMTVFAPFLPALANLIQSIK